MKRFVIGDIHGANKALKQCLDRSAFDFKNDMLIVLGDVCDGFPDTSQCFNTLLKIKNIVFLLGNHDWWTLEWAFGNEPDTVWLANGGQNTLKSYPKGMPKKHKLALASAHYYYELDNKLFVHAGIRPEVPVSQQDKSILLWDRSFVHEAISKHHFGKEKSLTKYDEIFVGHTPTHRLGIFEPVKFCEVWMMDTGAGWGKKLSIMDIDTHIVFQSDQVADLYPAGSGRF